VKGWTPTLTATVSVEAFREAVAEVGLHEAAVILDVSPKTIQNWRVGYGMPQPYNQPKIERFVVMMERTR
jgi:hypothetical protein